VRAAAVSAAADLLRQYNQIGARWGLPPRKATATARREAAAFLTWCQGQKVDPERYIRARLEAVGGRVRVPLKTLPSEKFLGTFRSFGDQRQAAQVSQERIAISVIPAGPAETLFEMMRRTLTGTRLCGRDVMTGGYSPTSPTCGTCFLREECRARGARVRS
jgi:hypothetical protein